MRHGRAPWGPIAQPWLCAGSSGAMPAPQHPRVHGGGPSAAAAAAARRKGSAGAAGAKGALAGLWGPGEALPRRLAFHAATQPDAHSAPLPAGVELLRGSGEPASRPPIRTGAGAEAQRPKGHAAQQGGGRLRPKDLEEAAAQASPEAPRAPASLAVDGVRTEWGSPRPVGSGLHNLGNTCFLNSVLQCLTYTPCLADFVAYHSPHGTACPVSGWCSLCAMRSHTARALAGAGKAVSPSGLVQNLRTLSRLFRPGRQEDAHEYMRCLLESMHRCLLPQRRAPGTKGTLAFANRLTDTFVHRAFGGYLRSQVQCTECSYCSRTYDPFLDLSLDIVKAHSVEKALERFTQAEVLDGAEKYRCSQCKKKVRALKGFRVETAPQVLTLHLKRFAAGAGKSIFGSSGGRKIDRHVEFGLSLDLSPFMSHYHSPQGPGAVAAGDRAGRHIYRLHGVLVHMGGSLHSGHYYCFIKGPSGHWHCLDDSRVTQVSERTVLSQRAYLLFYSRESSKPVSDTVKAPSGPRSSSGSFASTAPAQASPETKNGGKASTAAPIEQKHQSTAGSGREPAPFTRMPAADSSKTGRSTTSNSGTTGAEGRSSAPGASAAEAGGEVRREPLQGRGTLRDLRRRSRSAQRMLRIMRPFSAGAPEHRGTAAGRDPALKALMAVYRETVNEHKLRRSAAGGASSGEHASPSEAMRRQDEGPSEGLRLGAGGSKALAKMDIGQRQSAVAARHSNGIAANDIGFRTSIATPCERQHEVATGPDASKAESAHGGYVLAGPSASIRELGEGEGDDDQNGDQSPEDTEEETEESSEDGAAHARQHRRRGRRPAAPAGGEVSLLLQGSAAGAALRRHAQLGPIAGAWAAEGTGGWEQDGEASLSGPQAAGWSWGQRPSSHKPAKRDRYDDWDAELDRGRLKKVKAKKPLLVENGLNPFQDHLSDSRSQQQRRSF